MPQIGFSEDFNFWLKIVCHRNINNIDSSMLVKALSVYKHLELFQFSKSRQQHYFETYFDSSHTFVWQKMYTTVIECMQC